MQWLSREVLTLRYILDCEDGEEEEDTAVAEPLHSSHLLRLPIELRLEILRYVSCSARNTVSLLISGIVASIRPRLMIVGSSYA